MKPVLFSAFVSVLALSPAAAVAQTDSTFSYQGRLSDAGLPGNGVFGMEFRLFDALSGGSQVGASVVVPAQQVIDGVFSSELDFGYLDFGRDQYWLEVVVEGTVLSPRQAVLASPYSIQTRGLFVDLFNRLGVGTNDPSQMLHVNGNIQAEGWIGSDLNKPVSLWTNGVQVLHLTYEEFDDGTGAKPAPNILGGSSANRIQAGAVGSVIAGGGYAESINGVGNNISDSFCAILGGRDNQAGDNIVGIREQYATVGGGYSNAALSDYNFIGGGFDNITVGVGSSVVGGSENSATGGVNNFIGGGLLNEMDNPNSYSVITGGRENYTQADYAMIPGGFQNVVAGDYGFAAGRRAKSLHNGSFVWGDSTNLDIESTGSDQFLVRASGGMGLNTNAPLASFHVRSLGLDIGSASVFNEDVLIEDNDAVLGLYSGGGGDWSSGVVLGELDEFGALADKWAIARQTVGSSSRLQLTYGTSENYAANTQVVSINKTGQVGIGILPFFPLHMSSGAHCSVGGTWTNASSKSLKENFEQVDRRDILNRLLMMPISRWNYKSEGDDVEHIGPMAEDFAAAFDTGKHDTSIATVDADGVAIASIQALYEIIQEKDDEIKALNERLSSIEALLAESRSSE